MRIIGDYLGFEGIVLTGYEGLRLETAQEDVAMVSRNVADAVHRDRQKTWVCEITCTCFPMPSYVLLDLLIDNPPSNKFTLAS